MAYSVAEAVALDNFASACNLPLLGRSKQELFYRVNKSSWVSVYAFGAIAFCNVDRAECDRLMALTRQCARNPHMVPTTEDHKISARKGKPVFETSKLTVAQVTATVIRIIMQNIAYSATLEHYRRVAANLLEATQTHVRELEEKGKILLKAKALHQFIGRVLTIKNRIAEHLFVFSNLDAIRENDHLTAIHRGTANSLELKTRFEEVANSFRIIEENLHMFNEFYMHGQSYRIEVIITLLIVIEVLDLIGDKFRLFH